MADAPTKLIENTELLYSNFVGRAGRFNREGEYDLTVSLHPGLAEEMLEEGWNVKVRNPREEGDEPQPFLPIDIRFDRNRPPNIVLITSTARTKLTEKTMEILDWADIELLDIVVRGHVWEDVPRVRIKAYLQTLYATINEDPLDRKYGYYEDPPEAD